MLVADGDVDELVLAVAGIIPQRVDVVEAREVRRRKFGASAPRNLGERAKQARFLQYRGFSTDQIRAAMASMAGNTSVSALSDSDFDDSN